MGVVLLCDVVYCIILDYLMVTMCRPFLSDLCVVLREPYLLLVVYSCMIFEV